MSIRRLKIGIPCALLFVLLTLVACNGSAPTSTSHAAVTPSPTASPGSDRGSQLLAKAGQTLNGARTLHAIVDITIAGPALNGSLNSETWNLAPDKSRTVVLQSNIARFNSGIIIVNDGQRVWQYDPQQKVVYSEQVTTTSAGTPTSGENVQDQSQQIFTLVRTVFTHSNATQVSSTATINGRPAYDIAITSQAQASGSNAGGFSKYSGDVYLDKTTNLPLRVTLNVQGFGQITLTLPTLILNQPLAQSLFTFTPPPGVKVLPFPTVSSTTGTLTLTQAQQQAGYHLLSIPTTQSAYQLQSVDALGAPGNQIFALNYLYQANNKFTISEGKALANLPTSGQQVSLRGTTGSIATVGNNATLSWTEKGVGMQIAGTFSATQLLAIANLLA